MRSGLDAARVALLGQYVGERNERVNTNVVVVASVHSFDVWIRSC